MVPRLFCLNNIMTPSKSSRWAWAFLYVGFIYATLNVVRIPVQFLRHHNCLRLSLGLLCATCFLYFIRQLHQNHFLKTWRTPAVVAIFLIYLLMGKKIGTPEEQIHFFEYGLVGILFSKAVQQHTHRRLLISLGALILTGLSGWVDELIQGQLASRHYDIKDVWLNAGSGLLGIVLFHLVYVHQGNPDDLNSTKLPHH